jgi:hypothetical protein
MKQYDKIYVPHQLGLYAVRAFDEDLDDFTTVEDADKLENVIILTIEELEQTFAAGAMYGAKMYHPDWEERPDFKTYLTSKGITI